MFEVISKVIQNKIKMLSQGVAKGNLSVTTRRVITENAPFANRSESDSDLLRIFEITSTINPPAEKEYSPPCGNGRSSSAIPVPLRGNVPPDSACRDTAALPG